jgi:hypothetical protein
MDFTIRIWDVKSGRLIQELATRGVVWLMDFASDGRRLAAWSDKGGGARQEVPSLQIWDVRAGRPVLSLEGHTEAGTAVRFHPSGRRLLTASFDGSVRQWDAFPWRASDYAASGPGTLEEKIQRYTSVYWRERRRAESRNDQPEGAVDRQVFVPFDRSRLPSRDPATPARLLDLTAHYTDALKGRTYSATRTTSTTICANCPARSLGTRN